MAWHFLLYMVAQLIEFSPAVAEWLGLRKLRKRLTSLTLGAVIFGITLSTLHQSGLGALVMMAEPNIHPLWYTEFIPVLFLISSIFAGLSMVIVEGSISRKVFRDQLDKHHRVSYEGIVTGLSKGCAGAMFGYFFLKALVFIHGKDWVYLNTPMGYWYLVEVVGLVLIPCYHLRAGGETQEHRRHPRSSLVDHGRHHHKQVQLRIYRLQMVHTLESEVCSKLDGGNDRPYHSPCRYMGVQMDREQDACDQKISPVGYRSGQGGGKGKGKGHRDGVKTRRRTMNGFRYEDLFATKHLEYLLVIGFLGLLILFWRFMQTPAGATLEVAGMPLPSFDSWFNLPEGFYYHRGHSWAMPQGGLVKVGIDDFAQKMMGPSTLWTRPRSGPL